MIYARSKTSSLALVTQMTSVKCFLRFLEKPTIKCWFKYLKPGDMVFQPSECAHAVLTLSTGRSVIAGWEGCKKNEPERVSRCLNYYPSILSKETVKKFHGESASSEVSSFYLALLNALIYA